MASRRLDFAILAAGLAVSGTLIAGEALTRVLNPKPRVQVVRDGVEDVQLRTLHNTVVWFSRTPKVDRDACAGATDDTFRVAVVGSSIMRGSGLEGPDVWTERIRARFEGEDVCVENRAQQGSSGEQKRAHGLAVLEEQPRVDLLIYEVWTNDRGHFMRLGDQAFDVEPYPLDDEGRPDPLGLPNWLDGRLFGGSALYTYAVFALGAPPEERRRVGDLWPDVIDTTLKPVVEAAQAQSTEVLVVFAPPLDRPFADSVAEPYDAYPLVETYARSVGVETLSIAERLVEEDVEAMRFDDICHYSAAGHARLADMFEVEIRRRLNR